MVGATVFLPSVLPSSHSLRGSHPSAPLVDHHLLSLKGNSSPVISIMSLEAWEIAEEEYKREELVTINLGLKDSRIPEDI